MPAAWIIFMSIWLCQINSSARYTNGHCAHKKFPNESYGDHNGNEIQKDSQGNQCGRKFQMRDSFGEI